MNVPSRTVSVNPDKLRNLTSKDYADTDITKTDVLDDVVALVKLLRHHECRVNPMQAYWMWLELSISMSATWLVWGSFTADRAIDMLVSIKWLTVDATSPHD